MLNHMSFTGREINFQGRRIFFFFSGRENFQFWRKVAEVKIASPRVNMIDRRLEEAF